METKFWLIWNPASNLPPKVQFVSEADADRAAAEMAERHGGVFYVCEARSRAERAYTPVRRVLLRVKRRK